MRTALLVAGVVLGLSLGMQVDTACAGTQDFVLVNQTGTTINNLFISETSKDDWEEDVLGEDVLEDGESVQISFSGKQACSWDLMVKDEDGEGVYWRKINLCEVAKVVLHCDDTKCWATFE